MFFGKSEMKVSHRIQIQLKDYWYTWPCVVFDEDVCM